MNNLDIDQEFEGRWILVDVRSIQKWLSVYYTTNTIAHIHPDQCVLILFEDVLEVRHDCRALLNKSDHPQGIYDLLNKYFKVLEQDPEEFINFFKEDALQQIQKLHSYQRKGIERFNKLRQEIIEVKQQFGEALGHAQFRKAFRDILKLKNYHQSEEWGKLEDKVSSFVLQFEDQKTKN